MEVSEGTEYPVRHFEMMARVARRCRGMQAQILEHVYQHSAGGSWLLYFNFRGVLYRVVLDGRESALTLERAADPRRQDFAVVETRRPGKEDLEFLVDGMLDALDLGTL